MKDSTINEMVGLPSQEKLSYRYSLRCLWVLNGSPEHALPILYKGIKLQK